VGYLEEFSIYKMTEIDIWSKGEVFEYLKSLLNSGQIKDCEYLKIKIGYANAFYPECLKNMASRIPARNVYTNSTGYNAPSLYSWPKCQEDCVRYSKTDNIESWLEDRDNKKTPSNIYVSNNRIEELKEIKHKKYDLTKLIELCNELNHCFSRGDFLAVSMLVRAIIDHVPPIFGKQRFKEVVNNYPWKKSYKKAIENLENSLRNIADIYLHAQIRQRETLPNEIQVNFSQSLDLLLSEIITILQKK